MFKSILTRFFFGFCLASTIGTIVNLIISAAVGSGEFTTVKELASMVGYKDPLYFGKVFKQHYGTSPVHMNQ